MPLWESPGGRHILPQQQQSGYYTFGSTNGSPSRDGSSKVLSHSSILNGMSERTVVTTNGERINFVNAPLSDDPYVSKGCIQCSKIYTEAANRSGACRYHPGTFKSSESAMVQQKRWTCCKQTDAQGEGCAVTRHEPDTRMTAILRHFEQPAAAVAATNSKSSQPPVLPSFPPQRTSSSASASAPPPVSSTSAVAELLAGMSVPGTQTHSSGKEEIEESRPRSGTGSSTSSISSTSSSVASDGQIVHSVLRSDTLQGVALRYGISVEQLRRANKLMFASATSSIPHATLIIPAPTASVSGAKRSGRTNADADAGSMV